MFRCIFWCVLTKLMDILRSVVHEHQSAVFFISDNEQGLRFARASTNSVSIASPSSDFSQSSLLENTYLYCYFSGKYPKS